MKSNVLLNFFRKKSNLTKESKVETFLVFSDPFINE